MPERVNSNPDRKDFLKMLGDPEIGEDELLSLSNIFRLHVEATARLRRSVLQSSETQKQEKESMVKSLQSALDKGVDSKLVKKARNLGIKAAED